MDASHLAPVVHALPASLPLPSLPLVPTSQPVTVGHSQTFLQSPSLEHHRCHSHQEPLEGQPLPSYPWVPKRMEGTSTTFVRREHTLFKPEVLRPLQGLPLPWAQFHLSPLSPPRGKKITHLVHTPELYEQLTVVPFGPCSPFIPSGPSGPGGPGIPFLPWLPWAPLSPFCPFIPSAPFSPRPPGSPLSPLVPLTPSAPAGPIGPCQGIKHSCQYDMMLYLEKQKSWQPPTSGPWAP